MFPLTHNGFLFNWLFPILWPCFGSSKGWNSLTNK